MDRSLSRLEIGAAFPVTSLANPYGSRLSRAFVIALGLYFAAHVMVRTLATTSLEMDEAEQVFLTQWFLLGYSPNPPINLQPPLYTWLQWSFFQLFGVGVIGLSLLKNLLLFLTFMLVFLTGLFFILCRVGRGPVNRCSSRCIGNIRRVRGGGQAGVDLHDSRSDLFT